MRSSPVAVFPDPDASFEERALAGDGDCPSDAPKEDGPPEIGAITITAGLLPFSSRLSTVESGADGACIMNGMTDPCIESVTGVSGDGLNSPFLRCRRIKMRVAAIRPKRKTQIATTIPMMAPVPSGLEA